MLGEPKGGFSEQASADDRPSAPIGVVRAACKANKQTVVFGNVSHSVVSLLGMEDVREIVANRNTSSANGPSHHGHHQLNVRR